MDGPLNFNTTSSMIDYIEKLAERLQRGLARERLSSEVFTHLRRVTLKDLHTNQCEHVEGVRRWTSALLDSIEHICRSLCYSEGRGLSKVGLTDKDLRVMRAIAAWEAIVKLDIRGQVARSHPALDKATMLQAYDQLIDYFQWRSKSRPAVKAGLVRVVRQHANMVAPYGVTTGRMHVDPSFPVHGLPPFSKMEINHVLSPTKDDLTPAQIQEFLYSQACKRKEGVANVDRALQAYFNSKFPRLDLSTTNESEFMLQSPQVPTQSQPLPINLNYGHAAVEDIRHVYGVPVKQLTLAQLTQILTNRQGEVDRIKAIPHKPEAIKAQLTKLKAEIKDILALTNELFPVTE
jgi:hypothetical protein